MLMVGTALAGGLMTFGAPTAQAHYSQCLPGQFCIWEHSRYEGRFMSSAGDVSYVGSAMNDKMTSLWNRSNRVVCMFRDGDYRNIGLCVAPNGSSAAVPMDNDSLSSFKRS
ncbi:peptidase inhibitor family I36 protein [Streptomyces zaomyceticus]|uniref:peptidase inhibitor family I36 protein n=1 Tax=Streptomyces zaomyceticus TaxID=68286 RepID=UPI0036CC91BA